jgi:hypothetical protein
MALGLIPVEAYDFCITIIAELGRRNGVDWELHKATALLAWSDCSHKLQ